MARTISEIKKEITDRFMSDRNIQRKYGFLESATFEETFSKVSIESIMFFCVAACVWTLEVLFDYHKAEITTIIDELKPHSLRWYVSKAKNFMLGKMLVEDTDYYDVAGMTDEQIESLKIIKYAAAVEVSGVVYLKIATTKNDTPAQISSIELDAFTAYIKEVKDAGVVVEVVNEPAEYFRLKMTIYYNPMILDGTGQSFQATFPVRETINAFIANLPFNGEYRNVALVDALQQTEGVVIPELHLAETSLDGKIWEAVEAKTTPHSGYYKVYADNHLDITFIPYETISR